MYLEKEQINRLLEYVTFDDDVIINAVYYNPYYKLNPFEIIVTQNEEKYSLHYPMFHKQLTTKDINYILKGEKDGNEI